MLALTRMFLHNWHRFHHHTIPVERGAHATGYSGADWRAILDALRLALTADMQSASHNLAPAAEAHAPAYVALEFTSTPDESAFTLGVCIEANKANEASETTPLPCTCFLFAEPLNPDHLAPGGKALSRHQLKQTLPALRSAQTYDQVSEYQAEMIHWLGDVSPRFFALFGQATSFEGPDTIRQFIDQWLLEARPLGVETLQRVARPYALLTSEARELEEKLTALRAIVEQQEAARTLRQQHAEHALLAALLRLDISHRRTDWFEQQLAHLRQQIAPAETEHTQTRKRLREARATLLDTEVQVRQTSVMRRHEDLQREIRQATSEATIIHARWITLLHDLKREEATLRPLLDSEPHPPHLVREETDTPILLTDEELATLRSLLDTIAALDADQPPPHQLAALVDAAIPVLDAALARAQEVYFQVRHRLDEQRQQSSELEAALLRLHSGERNYPQEVERVCELLTHILGERPPLLCEVLEIPSERWQNVVEAMLGSQRFTILVQPRFVNIARQVIDRARAHENIYNVGVLNIGESLHRSRPIPPESLAHQVQTEFPALRPYLDTVLGDIMTCETVDQLHHYSCAVTSDVVLYREWTTRALSPHEYRPWFIGKRAQRSQIENHEHMLGNLQAEIAARSNQAATINLHLTRLKRVRALSNLRQRLDAPLDEKPLRTQVADYMVQQRALDTSDIDDLLRSLERLHTSIEHDEERAQHLLTSLARWHTDLQRCERDLEATHSELNEHKQQAAEARARFAYAEAAAEHRLNEHHAPPDKEAPLPDAPPSYAPLGPIEAAARSFERRMIEAVQQLTSLAAAHNSRFNFAAEASDPDEPRYADEEQRLIVTDLPRYQDELEAVQRQAMEELRDHVLLPLHERIQTARQQLERFNEALSRLELYGERYRFSAHPADDLQGIQAVLSGIHALEGGDILANSFYQAHKTDCEHFYAMLTTAPHSDKEQHDRERLLDYRNYYTYDLEITYSDGQIVLLSAHLAQQHTGHGAHTNLSLPFYLTIAAAFAQIYHLGGHTGRPTLRLVALNEAFSRMGQQNAGAVLDTFERLGLQVITAALPDA